MSDPEKWLKQLISHRKFPEEKKKKEEDDDMIQPSTVSPEEHENLEKLQEEHEEAELEDDFKEQVRVAAYFISTAGYSYDDLCWILAEKILKETYKMGTALSMRDLSIKAEEINHKSLNYDELCWLNGELEIIIKKYFDK